MALRFPTATRNAVASAVAALFDGGTGPGTIEIRSGAQPANANDVASGTLLATFTLNDPAFGSPAVGVATLDVTPIPATTAVANGTAGWFRAKNSSGGTVLDGSVTATGNGGDIELSTTTISVGLALEITSGTLTAPAG